MFVRWNNLKVNFDRDQRCLQIARDFIIDAFSSKNCMCLLWSIDQYDMRYKVLSGAEYKGQSEYTTRFLIGTEVGVKTEGKSFSNDKCIFYELYPNCIADTCLILIGTDVSKYKKISFPWISDRSKEICRFCMVCKPL